MAIKKKIVEKKTTEKYASKAAMAKHEKGESKAMQKKEMMSPAKQLKSPAKMKKY
tara:strand:- start:318 stop:482 length:165 start_codon:yes stop_codon:yes gene_type:complete